MPLSTPSAPTQGPWRRAQLYDYFGLNQLLFFPDRDVAS